MLEHGWSPRVARALAERLGVSKRTVYRIKERVERDIRRGLGGRDLDTERADFLMRIRLHQIDAKKSGSFGALSSMMGVEARVLGLADWSPSSSARLLTDLERREAKDALAEMAEAADEG